MITMTRLFCCGLSAGAYTTGEVRKLGRRQGDKRQAEDGPIQMEMVAAMHSQIGGSRFRMRICSSLNVFGYLRCSVLKIISGRKKFCTKAPIASRILVYFVISAINRKANCHLQRSSDIWNNARYHD